MHAVLAPGVPRVGRDMCDATNGGLSGESSCILSRGSGGAANLGLVEAQGGFSHLHVPDLSRLRTDAIWSSTHCARLGKECDFTPRVFSYRTFHSSSVVAPTQFVWQISQERMDPFDTMSLSMDAKSRELVHYCMPPWPSPRCSIFRALSIS